MKSIFEYSDYRLFLQEFLRDARLRGAELTYDELGRKLGFISKGFITQILQGKSKIPEDKILKFAAALGLKKKEEEYFEALVRFDQARTHRLKNEQFQKLISRFKTRIRCVGPDQYEFYNEWYYSAIRSLLSYYPFKGDYEQLAQQLVPQITPRQARNAVELLERLSMIKKDTDGYYQLTDRILSSGGSVERVAIVNFQKITMDLARESLEKFPKNQRDSSTLTLGLSEEGYRTIVEKIALLRKELLDVARLDRKIDRVIQINLHAFPLSKIGRKKS